MLLKELAKEYRESAYALKERIDKLNEKSKSDEICEMERLRVRRRKEQLSTMYYDTLQTAKYLEEYYAGKAK